MTLKMPDSMDECVYFTNRSLLDESGKPAGKIVCWARRVPCPKCKKGLMAKPWDEKEKKFEVRATEYVCPECHYKEQKKDHEANLVAEAMYTCPSCHKQGEGEAPYQRKSFMGVKAIVFTCQHCKAPIPVTKKLKDIKKKGKATKDEAADDDDDF